MITKTLQHIPPNAPAKNNGFSIHAFPVASRLRFQLTLLGSGYLPEYLGSTVRGVLGLALKRIICVTGAKKCAGCQLETTCLYPAFFETPPQLYPLNDNPLQAKPVGRPSVAVHPWLLDMDSPTSGTHLTAGKVIEFNLILLGEAAKQYIPYLIISLQRAERGGIGKMRLPFTLSDASIETALGQGVWQPLMENENRKNKTAAWPNLRITHPAIPPCPEVITLHLQTPLRLKNQGHYLAPQKLTLRRFLYAVIERMRHIQHAWGESSMENLPLTLALSGDNFISSRLYWKDWERYSNRQKTPMKIGGIMGELSFLGASLPQGIWPQLWLAQWLHLGKQTAMGLGQYRLRRVNLP